MSSTTVTPNSNRRGRLTVEFFQTRRVGKWSWRLKAANNVNWAGPDKNKGFFSQASAKRSFWDMVTALGADPHRIDVKVIPRKGMPAVYDGRTDTK